MFDCTMNSWYDEFMIPTNKQQTSNIENYDDLRGGRHESETSN